MDCDDVIVEEGTEVAKPIQVVEPFKEDGEVVTAKQMLESLGIDYMDRKHNTLLHQCVPVRSPMAVYVYASAGVPVNYQNTDGDTALHLAVQSGNLDLIRALLQCGASPLIRNKLGQTPFHHMNKRTKPLCEEFEPGLLNAIDRGNHGALKRLLRLHCSLDTNIKDGMRGVELTLALCDKDARYHKCYYSAVIEDLYTVRLVHMVKIQDHETVKQLLESGKVKVNFRYKNHLGRTPLVDAIERNDTEMVELLLQHGAMVDIRINEDDENEPSMPLPHLVSRKTCPLEIVKAVVERARDYIKEKDSRGFTVLHKAIANNADLKTIEYLCSAHDGALVYTRDAQGRIPRQLAIAMQRTAVARVIEEVTSGFRLQTVLGMMVNFYGLDNFNFDDKEKIKMAQLCEKKGRIQLSAAVEGDVETVVSLMTGDYRDENGYTALIKAIACNRLEVVRAMINKHHRLKTVPDNSNRYPLHYAYALPDNIGQPFVQLLLERNPQDIEFLQDKDGLQPADYINLRDSIHIQDMLHKARTVDQTSASQ